MNGAAGATRKLTAAEGGHRRRFSLIGMELAQSRAKTGSSRRWQVADRNRLLFARGCHADFNLDRYGSRPDYRSIYVAGGALRAGAFARRCRATIVAWAAAARRRPDRRLQS